MTLKQLEYFLEIAKMGSVTKAAQNLNISQPPLSLQLKALEEELGATLFTRDKHRLEITTEGKLLQERATAILSLLNEMVQDVQALSEQKQTVIRIGTIGSVNNRVLPEKISQFCRSYPYVNFRVIEGGTDTILSSLTDGQADLGFVREPFNVSSFRFVPVRDPMLGPDEPDYFATIAHANFYDDPSAPAIKLEELQGKPLVTHSRYRDMLVNACRKRGFSPHIICENGEIQSSLSWAQADIGIAVAPFTSAVQTTDQSLLIKRLESMNFSPRVCLVWNQGVRLSAEALAFINMM